MDARDLLRRLIMAPMPRERERWHAVWLLAQGWTASGTAQAQGRDPHTIGRWAAAFGEGGPAALMFEQSGGSPFRLRLTKELASGTFSQTRACVLQTARLVCKTCVSILTGDQVLPGRNQSCLNIA